MCAHFGTFGLQAPKGEQEICEIDESSEQKEADAFYHALVIQITLPPPAPRTLYSTFEHDFPLRSCALVPESIVLAPTASLDGRPQRGRHPRGHARGRRRSGGESGAVTAGAADLTSLRPRVARKI